MKISGKHRQIKIKILTQKGKYSTKIKLTENSKVTSGNIEERRLKNEILFSKGCFIITNNEVPYLVSKNPLYLSISKSFTSTTKY